jgi:hypothetical protein
MLTSTSYVPENNDSHNGVYRWSVSGDNSYPDGTIFTCSVTGSVECSAYSPVQGYPEYYDFNFSTYVSPAPADTSISSVSGSGTYGGTATLTATLESDSSALKDKNVEFTLGENAVCDTDTDDDALPDCPTTDEDGLATLENVSLSGYTAADSPYENEVSASFAGDRDYEQSSAQGDLTVGKAEQDTLTVNAPASMTYGQDAATLTTSGGNNGTGAVSYDVGSSTGCSVSVDQLTVTDASGTCSVTATKAADGNYNNTTSDAVRVTLGKASQTIGFDALANKTYGDEDFTLSATGGDSQNPVTFALGSGSVGCSLSGTNNATVTITGVTGATDKCIITASQAGNTNYEAATSVTRDFTIAKAALTIAADNKSMTYGDNLPTFSYTPTGFMPGDTASVISGSVSYSTNPQASSSSAAGTYAIVPDISGLSATNYTLIAQNGTLTVDKRQANVAYTGDNYTAVASGNANINLSANVSRTNSSTAGNLALAEVEFSVKKFGGGVQTTAYATADANGVAKTTASIPASTDPYTVEVRIRPTNSYWKSGTDIGSLSVVPSSGSVRTAGGGWIADDKNTINAKSNFGFSVQNSKTGMKGNSLFIYRVLEGSDQVQYVVKSNSWQGGGLSFKVNNDPARATFTGKANVQRYVNGVQDTSFNGGNHTFTVDDLDGDLKNPKVKDGYAITVRNSANQIVKQLGSRATPVTLGGGNVLIQAK